MKTRMVLVAMALALGTSSRAQSPPSSSTPPEEVKKKLDDFRKEWKEAKTDGDRAYALQNLGQLRDPKIFGELRKWLAHPSLDVAGMAAEQIAKYPKDAAAAELLVKAAAARKDKDGIVRMLRCAGDVGYRATADKLFSYFRHKEPDVAREAVDSCAKLKAKVAVDPILNLARELEAIREDQNQGSGGPAPGEVLGGLPTQQSQQNMEVQRKRTVLPACLSALEQITGQRFSSVKEWTDWWRKNKATFKEPQ